MNFKERIGKVTQNSIFKMEDYFVWCGTMTKGDDGLYYLYFSFWPKTGSFDNDWVICSKIGYAVSDNPCGGFSYQGIALDSGTGWDSGSVHNPAVIKHNGKYYMYYMGNYGNGEFWNHRNHQRIGVAVAENPEGPWQRFDKPVIDVSPKGFDSLMTSNPSVTIGDDGKCYMIYKAVADNGIYPKGGAVVCGIAVAEKPDGPFVKHDKPILVNPENDWSVEDAFIWQENGKLYAIAKDFQGYFTKSEKGDLALFCSEDAVDWEPAENPLALKKELPFENTTVPLFRMERPQIYFEDGRPKVLLCACMPSEKADETFNISIPMLK